MTLKTLSRALAAILIATANPALAQRTTTLLNDDWKFAPGNAASMEQDFTHGTEYFTYLSKAASAGNNRGPAMIEFNDSSWQTVTLPHDWATALPFAAEASHSHGYKQIGWKYPQNSIGWYRKHVYIPKEWNGGHVEVTFDGIYRNAQVFCNGFYLGCEPSGYISQSYDLTDYLNYGGDNVLTVRADASMEEGWYYEGAGIYRDVWLTHTPKQHITALWIDSQTDGTINARINTALMTSCKARIVVSDASGNTVATGMWQTTNSTCQPTMLTAQVRQPRLWSAGTPYLYKVRVELSDGSSQSDGMRVIDTQSRKTGFRSVTFDTIHGMRINGNSEKLRGFNMHLDHAGVGTAVPDSLWTYIIKKLKGIGGNAIRCSHNPATPAMLRACDSLGMYVIDENRLMGTTSEYYRQMKSMIDRDQYHPSVILWSIGNEEWAIESGERGERIARRMVEWCHTLDSSRLTTYGNSGGYGIVKDVDVHGYNYIVQNDVDNRHREHPDWVVIGTEETSGCGTRGETATDAARGVMQSINTAGEERSAGEKNVIERGWHFYRDNPWAAGVFYWTGFDYRGEPNPMKWVSTGSQFGIFDYCGFPKDEAYYLKAAWTREPVVHIVNAGLRKASIQSAADSTELWVYTNCPEVELTADGKRLGRKHADKDSHTVWLVAGTPQRITAKGYNEQGKIIATDKVVPSGKATKVIVKKSKNAVNGEQDILVLDLTLTDSKGNFAASACDSIVMDVPAGIRVLGWGNGNPATHDPTPQIPSSDKPATLTISAFNGHAQVIIASDRPYSGTPTFKITQ